MASEILGLFASPELYQQQRNAEMQQQAADYASLNPYQRASFNAALAGQQAGSAIGGLLGGGDQQLKIITARQNVMRNVDPANPQSIANAAEALMRAGDQQGALTLADYARKASSETALAAQRAREGRAAATPKELQIAAARAQLQGSLRELQTLPQSAERDVQIQTVKDTLASLPIKSEGLVREQQIARDLALADGEEGSDAFNTSYRKNLKDLTSKESQQKLGEFERVLNSRYPDTPENAQKRAELLDRFLESEITGRKAGKSTKIELGLPGQGKDGVKDVPAFRDKVINTIDPFRKTVTATDQALSNIQDSLKTNNFASYRAAQTQFARAISGAGDLSQKELKAAGADPSLLGGTTDYLSTLFTSTPSKDTQTKMLSTLKAIRTVAAKKAKEELTTQKKIATRAGYTQDDTDLIFNFPEFETRAPSGGGGGKTRTVTTKSGKTVTVTED
jgi:hypothetical protein